MQPISFSRRAFTLIELLVVVTISAFLAALAILYSSVGRNEVALSVQAAAIAQTVGRARAFSVATYANASVTGVCAYGVGFDTVAQQYMIVAYHRPSGAAHCPDMATVKAAGVSAGDISPVDAASLFKFQSGVKMVVPGGSMNSLSLVLFYPPDPAVFLSANACLPGDSTCTYDFFDGSGAVNLATVDGAASTIVQVGPTGQITW